MMDRIRQELSLLFLLTLISSHLISVTNSTKSQPSNGTKEDTHYLQIPDHQGFINKLYYYRLPLSSTHFHSIENLTIKEVDADRLPDWLILKKEKDRWELIGFPQEQDKGIHFFQIEMVRKGSPNKIADVFTIEIVTSLPSTFNPSSPTTSSHPNLVSSSSNGANGNCIIRVMPTFSSILDVWKIISYLIPSKLRQEIALSTKLFEYTDALEETDDPNLLMAQWSHRLFTISQTQGESVNSRKHQLTIENQECSIDKMDGDDFYWKLKKLGLEFHHIMIMKSPSHFVSSGDDSLYDDSNSFSNTNHADESGSHPPKQSNGVDPSRAYSKSYVPVSIDFDSYDSSHRRHARRHLPDLKPTPTTFPDFMTISSTLTHLDPDEWNEIEPSQLSRIVPSLTSPSAFPSTSIYPDSFITPKLPGTGNSGVGVGSFDGFSSHFHPVLYTTPTPTADPPSLYVEDLSTPTPVLPSISLPDQSSLLTPKIDLVPSSVNLISPSPTFGPGLTPSHRLEDPIVFEGTDKIPTGDKPTDPARPAIVSNSRPELRVRIPKLAPIAGKYWSFPIPQNTFYDAEDGPTNKLKLGFYRVSSSSKERIHPAKDFWIQFDAENQVLTAYPTDDDVGVYENQFYLEAVDSSGLSNVENITIHVRQHTSYRKFPYNITFYRVYWDPLRISTTIKALRNFAQIVAQVNGDFDIDSFVVQHWSKETFDGKDYWTIVSTNDSIPAYPCPIKKIQYLYDRLADKQSKGQYALPSEVLTHKMNKIFSIEGVGLSISCSKPNTAAERPELRNPIDQLKFKLGEIFRYKIPENVFFSGRGRNTYNLDLTLYDGYGRVLSADGFVKFNEKAFEIIGLADDRRYIGENEFNLVARERDSKNDASDALVIVIEDTWPQDVVSFTVTIGISMNEKMGIEDKLDVAHRIATIMFNDPDTSSLRVLKVVKKKFTLLQTGAHSGLKVKKIPNLPDIDENENSVDHRRKRSDFYDESNEDGAVHQMYEFVWTNGTETLSTRNGICPSSAIQSHILHRLFNSEMTFDSWDEKFADKYRVQIIEFKPVGKCSGVLTSLELYRDGLKPQILPDREVSPQPTDNVHYGQASPKDYDVHANELDDYYLRTIIPAIVTVAILLIVLVVIVFILVKCRRDIDKNRFDFTLQPGIDGYPTEVDAFIQKGRRPVILQSDYQQHLPMNTMMVTYNPARQQTYSMANVNKAQYHAFAHAVERRQPPPYR